jgi:hypothetical protein
MNVMDNNRSIWKMVAAHSAAFAVPARAVVPAQRGPALPPAPLLILQYPGKIVTKNEEKKKRGMKLLRVAAVAGSARAAALAEALHFVGG